MRGVEFEAGRHALLRRHVSASPQVHFGRVLMKPGKPLTFATLDIAADGQQQQQGQQAEQQGPRKLLVFGLPGARGPWWLRRAAACLVFGAHCVLTSDRRSCTRPRARGPHCALPLLRPLSLAPCRQPRERLCVLQPRRDASPAQDVGLGPAAAAAAAGAHTCTHTPTHTCHTHMIHVCHTRSERPVL
jgi:hypothetical protein